MTRRFIIVFALVAALFAGVVTAAVANDCDGIVMYDGTCMTVERYNETFSVENLSTVPSFMDPSRSVAEVYNLIDDGVEAADRPRVFGGKVYPTFREYVRTINGGPQIW